MATRLIFVNLPVADVPRATAFYEAIGATKNPMFSDASGSCMVHSETIHTMLLSHEKFLQFSPRPVADAKAACQVLLCISADSRAEVDDIVTRAGAAGGGVDPALKMDAGFMYGRSFEDLDGHIWEVMWMDMAAAQTAMAKD